MSRILWTNIGMTMIVVVQSFPTPQLSLTQTPYRFQSSQQQQQQQQHEGKDFKLYYINDPNNKEEDETKGAAAPLVQKEHRQQHDLVQSTKSKPFAWNKPMKELEQEDDSWKEWHYSFSRNGLTDFLPQFSSHLNCLLVDIGHETTSEAASYSSHRLPWEKVSRHETVITPLLLDSSSSFESTPNGVAIDGEEGSQSNAANDKLIDKIIAITTTTTTATATSSSMHVNTGVTGGLQAEYDCILDQGLMSSLIADVDISTTTMVKKAGSIDKSNESSTSTRQEFHSNEQIMMAHLFQEATYTLREHGIYVMVTNGILSPSTKSYLTSLGQSLGLQWQFDLDGISSSSKGIGISVARKFFTGNLPSVGHLAKTTTTTKTADPLLMQEGNSTAVAN